MSTRFRNALALLVLVALLLPLVAACGPTPTPAPTAEPTAEPTKEVEATREPCGPATEGALAGVDPRGLTVTWWHNHSSSREEKLKVMVDEFNASNECGITIVPENQGSYNDIRDKMNAGISTGELPGLVVGYQNDQAFYALADGLADIRPYMADEVWGLTAADREDFYAAFLDQGVHPAFGGQQLGFPPNRSMEVLFYNLTWLKELGFEGAPTTPDEFKAIACAAAAANGDGTGGYILRDDASAVASWAFAFGGNVLNADGTGYDYNSDAMVEAMTFLKGMYDEGCAYFFTEGYPNTELAARRAIFAQGSSSGIPFYQSDMEAAGNTDEWGVAAIPHTTADPVQNIYGGDIMIPKTDPATQLAAWVFLKWFTETEQQATWVGISGYFPTRDSTLALLDPTTLMPQWLQAADMLKYSTYEPQLISYQGVRDGAQQAFNEIMQGGDINEVLTKLNEDANALQAELMEGVE